VKNSSPPRVVKPVGEEEVKLVCNVRDAQNYTWYKNGKAILQSSGRYTVRSKRFLRITGRVQKSDSGVFVCVAANSYGSANCTIRLIVEGITFFLSKWPQTYLIKVFIPCHKKIQPIRVQESSCILDGITPNLSIVRRAYIACVVLVTVFFHGMVNRIKQLCSDFSWPTMEHPTCSQYFLGIHTHIKARVRKYK